MTTRSTPPRPAGHRKKGASPRLLVPGVLLGLLAVVAVAILSGRSQGRGSGSAAPKGVLGTGAPSPAVTLPATTGQTVDLASFRGRRNVLLYFYEHAG